MCGEIVTAPGLLKDTVHACTVKYRQTFDMPVSIHLLSCHLFLNALHTRALQMVPREGKQHSWYEKSGPRASGSVQYGA